MAVTRFKHPDGNWYTVCEKVIKIKKEDDTWVTLKEGDRVNRGVNLWSYIECDNGMEYAYLEKLGYDGYTTYQDDYLGTIYTHSYNAIASAIEGTTITLTPEATYSAPKKLYINDTLMDTGSGGTESYVFTTPAEGGVGIYIVTETNEAYPPYWEILLAVANNQNVSVDIHPEYNLITS